MEGSQLIKVAYADDQDLIRKGIIELVKVRNICEFIIEAGNGAELIQKLMSVAILPDICILDIVMPEMDGFATIHTIRSKWPEMKILILTGHTSTFYLKRMITAGANGYLPKDCAPADLVQALSTIHSKGNYYSEAAGNCFLHLVKGNGIADHDLSDRETEFLQYSCSEMKYEDIARKMFVSKKSVEYYRSSLFRKFNVSTRAGLVLYAIEHGLVIHPNVR